MYKRHITEQQTMPFPLFRYGLPTLRQLRESYHLSYFEVAQAAKVHPRVVYWMEHGVRVYPIEAVYILSSFSVRTHGQYTYTFDNVRGIRLKNLGPVRPPTSPPVHAPTASGRDSNGK